MLKELLGYSSLIPAAFGFASYLWSIYKKRTKPHALSWIVWSVLLVVVLLAQLSEQAGPGAWVTGFSAAACVAIALLSLKYGEKGVTASDWLAFGGAAIILPIWYLTKAPLAAVILATAIDLLAYYPTVRKAYVKPFEESFWIHVADSTKWIPALFALEHYSLVTTLYPFVILTADALTATMIVWRRRSPEVNPNASEK